MTKMHSSWNRLLLWPLVVSLGGAGFACSDETQYTFASLATPTGLAVATQWNSGVPTRLLVVANAGEDTLRVLTMPSKDLDDVDYVYGPVNHFPLRIPAGAGPSDLAASYRGGYVVILDLLTESLRILNVNAGAPGAELSERLRLERDAQGATRTLSLGPAGVAPAALVAAPVAFACATEPCPEPVDRFLVSLAGDGAVLALELKVGGLPSEPTAAVLLPLRRYELGGQPEALAVDNAGRFAYVVDAASNEVVRIDLETGFTVRRPVGDCPNTLAVTPDGATLIVSRPELRDVTIFADANGAFVPFDANPVWAPLPRCLASCDGAVTCVGSHPADQAVCSTADGLAQAPGVEPYGALYLGYIAGKILPVQAFDRPLLGQQDSEDASSTSQPLAVQCMADGDYAKTYSDYALVATMEGQLLYLGLKSSAEADLAPELVSYGWCVAPGVTGTIPYDSDATDTVIGVKPADIEAAITAYSGADPTLRALFADTCPEFPERERFQCISEGTATLTVSTTVSHTVKIGALAVASGNLSAATVTLRWEGTLPNLSNVTTGHIVDGLFGDSELDLAELGIRPRELDDPTSFADPFTCDAAALAGHVTYGGDILKISANCLDTAGCGLERRIVGLSLGSDGRTLLHVCEPLRTNSAVPAEQDVADASGCLASHANIPYSIRAGDAFLVDMVLSDGVSLEPLRLGPGELLGLRGAPTPTVPFTMRLRDVDLTQFRAGEEPPTFLKAANYAQCQHSYVRVLSAEGVEVAPVERGKNGGLWLREGVYTLTLSDGYSYAYTTGLDTRSTTGALVGMVPGAMVLSPFGGSAPVAITTFSASNALLAMLAHRAVGTSSDTSIYRPMN